MKSKFLQIILVATIVFNYSCNESVSEKYKSRDNGDITKVKTISNFKKDILKRKHPERYRLLKDIDFPFDNQKTSIAESKPSSDKKIKKAG